MEEDDKTNLYEVTELQEYNTQKGHDAFQANKTQQGGSTNRYALAFLIVAVLLILLAVVITMGVSGVILTHLNTLSVCTDSTNTATGSPLTTSSSSCSDFEDQLSQILNITQSTQNNTQLLQQVSRVLQNDVNQLLSTTGSTKDKVDTIESNADDQMAYLLNLTDSLNVVLQTTNNSAQKLANIVDTLSSLKSNSISTASVVDDILPIVQELLNLQNGSSLFNSIRPVSCKDILNLFPNSPTGYYHVNSRTIYCNMGELCGSGGGWTRLAYLDMSDATENCPSGFRLYHSGGVRACGRPYSAGASTVSVKFPSNGINYTQICGRVTGYQYYSTDGIATGFGGGHNDLNSFYIEGVSLTRGSPRQHVWTFISGISDTYVINPAYMCPCSPGSSVPIQSFVGSHYFCESGNHNSYWSNTLYTSDPLWDGQGCGIRETACCSASGLPWFHRDYGTEVTDDYLELRVCGDQGTGDEDVPVGYYEIYVK